MRFLRVPIQTIASSTCPGESYHTNESEKFHKEGSYFNNFPGESDILAPLFEQFRSAIKLSDTNNPVTSHTLQAQAHCRRRINRMTSLIICLQIDSGKTASVIPPEAWIK